MTRVNTNNMSDRIARTRRFFELDSWSLDAADAWQHVLTGACDDDDLRGDKCFTALDMDNMFGEYRAFGSACNDAFHYLVEHIDEFNYLAGVVYIDCDNGAVEFVSTDDHERAEWLFTCAQNGEGVLLNVIVDSVGSICIELVA